jgi:cyclopropane fatty-acyl-phospholipid synthase-like methyltransferase
VLDAGCGVGASSIYLARTFGCRVDGITISPRQVGFARRNAARAKVGHLVEFHEMDYLATSFPDATFDVVWGLESICYAESKERFIRESHRVLKDGGRFVVADGYASRRDYSDTEKKMMDKWLDGWIVNYLETPEGSKIMYYSSMVMFGVFHLIDRFFPLKSYPADAVFHQHRALKRGLWQYGIFYAEK